MVFYLGGMRLRMSQKGWVFENYDLMHMGRYGIPAKALRRQYGEMHGISDLKMSQKCWYIENSTIYAVQETPVSYEASP